MRVRLVSLLAAFLACGVSAACREDSYAHCEVRSARDRPRPPWTRGSCAISRVTSSTAMLPAHFAQTASTLASKRAAMSRTVAGD